MKSIVKKKIKLAFENIFGLNALKLDFLEMKNNINNGVVVCYDKNKNEINIPFSLSFLNITNYEIIFNLKDGLLNESKNLNKFLSENIYVEKFSDINIWKTYSNMYFAMYFRGNDKISIHNKCTDGQMNTAYYFHTEIGSRELYNTGIQYNAYINISLTFTEDKIIVKDNFIKNFNKSNRLLNSFNLDEYINIEDKIYEFKKTDESINKIINIAYKNYFYYAMKRSGKNLFDLPIEKIFKTNYKDLIYILDSKKELENIINY